MENECSAMIESAKSARVVEGAEREGEAMRAEAMDAEAMDAVADKTVAENKVLSELRARLEHEIAAHKATKRELEDVRQQLQSARLELRRAVQAAREPGLLRESVTTPLNEEPCTAAQVYDTALRGSNVSVFTQDRDLRYVSLSKSLFGRDSREIIGRTDADILPSDIAASIVGVKREVLATGQSRDAELRVDSEDGVRWYDLHMEPLRDASGDVVGLTCAAVEITERKEGEAHLRLLLRELTHRSKNLLAVVQAMARQTARHGGTTANFLERFGARLQALSRSHDLLVQESWHGASLEDLVRSQLGPYFDRDTPQVSLAGPDIHLRPEAAQNLGLALHELATNAAKHGALSRTRGRVDIEWRLLPSGEGLEITWTESKGPVVAEPRRRGFGSMVIEHNLARSLDAHVQLSFEPGGLQCRMVIPRSQLAGR